MGRMGRIGRIFSIVFAIAATPVAVFAQVDLTGTWQRVGQHDNGAAREPVDLLGMPLSADGRAKALSYDIASLSATERQCQMYPPIYAIVGPFPLQFVMVPDPVTQKLLAWKILGWGDRDETMIWMDGRPHPSSLAPHSHGGFTTGQWEGDTLTSVTTHAKLGDIKRHRGFSSDRATLTMRFNRHGDLLTVTGILEDPVYLAEPYVLTEDFPSDDEPEQLPVDGVRADRGAAAPPRESGVRAALPAGQASGDERDDRALQHPARGGRRRTRDDVSGVPQEAEGQVRSPRRP